MAGIIKKDVNGNPMQDEFGLPILEGEKVQDKSDVGPHNEITITVDMLPDDLKKQYGDYMKGCQHKYFQTLKLIRGKVVQKMPVPEVLHLGETSASQAGKGLTREETSKMLNESLHQALINQSGMLSNTVKNLLKQTIDGTLFKELGFSGPAYTTPSRPPQPASTPVRPMMLP